jgi:hypothetical protein
MGELVVPPFVYIPLCSSLDPFSTIVHALPKECYAFNTKARCPALMMYEMETHPQHIDVATFLGLELERYSESEVVQERFELVQFTETAPENISFEKDGDIRQEKDFSRSNSSSFNNEKDAKPSKFGGFGKGQDSWAPEGTGLKRLQEAGIQLNLSIGKAVTDDDHNKASAHGSHGGGSPMKQRTSRQDSNNSKNGGASAAPPAESTLGETFDGKSQRVRTQSPYGHLSTWQLGGLIAKSNDDVRQEVFVMQMIQYYQNIFEKNHIPVWLHSYRILSTSKTTGLIELIPNSSSFDGVKKKSDYPGSLRAWYEKAFDYDPADHNKQSRFNQAMENYVASMAGYSIVTYLLGIKDRHNGNIMLNKDGHVIHIDFGFVFGLGE